jgi:hypothetical protein
MALAPIVGGAYHKTQIGSSTYIGPFEIAANAALMHPIPDGRGIAREGLNYIPAREKLNDIWRVSTNDR